MDGNTPAFRYWAFISYAHTDERHAKWLHKAIETWRVPRRFVGRPHLDEFIPRRLFPLFRDRDELASSAELGAVINEALRVSRYLIVICSPQAARSRWVNEEVRYFKSLGREQRVLALIVDGEPGSAAAECFCPALKWRVGFDGKLLEQPMEPIAADAREGRDGQNVARIKLLAGMLGVGFDELRQREKQRLFWLRVRDTAIAGMLVATVLGTWAAFEAYRARQARELYIEQVYELGRQELLAGRDMRAATYLSEAYRLGRDTPALRFMLGRAMAPLDALEPVRIETGGQVRRPVFSPDGRRLVTPTELRSAEQLGLPLVDSAGVWDVASGDRLAELTGLPPMPQIVRWLPDARRLLISGMRRYVTDDWQGYDPLTAIWDTATGEKLAHFEGHAGRFGAPLDPEGRRIVLADLPDEDGAQVRDVADGSVLLRLRSGARIRAASFSDDGKMLVTGDSGGEVSLWNAADGAFITRLPGRTPSGVVAVLFTPDRSRVMAVSEKGDLRFWDWKGRRLELAFAADPRFVSDIHFGAEGRKLLTVGRLGYRVWDLQRGTLEFELKGELGTSASADFSAQGHWLLTAPSDQAEAELWQVSGGARLNVFEQTSGRVSSAIFSPAGDRLAQADVRGRVNLYRLPIHQLAEWPHHPAVFASRFLPGTEEVVVAGSGPELKIFDTASGLMRRSWNAHDQRVFAAVPDPRGGRIATSGEDGQLKIWETRQGRLSCSASLDGGQTWEIRYTADGSALTTLGPYSERDPTLAIRVWDAQTCAARHSLKQACTVWRWTLAPAANRLLTLCDDGRAKVWNVDTGEAVQSLHMAGGRPVDVGYSRSTPFAILEHEAGNEVRLVDVASARIVDRFPLPEGDDALSAALLADGRGWAVGTTTGRIYIKMPDDRARLAGTHAAGVKDLQPMAGALMLAAGEDGAISLWDTVRRQVLATVATHRQAAWDTQLDEQRHWLLTGGLDGAARLWSLSPETRTPQAVEAKMICMSPWRLDGLELKRAENSKSASCLAP